MEKGRELYFSLLTGLSILFLLFANFSFWLSNNIYNLSNFKNNALEVFHDQAVRDAVAQETVDRILASNPGLKQIISSPIQSAISGMLDSSFLNPVVNKAAEKFQNYITTGQNEVSIDLSPINNILTALARVTSGQANISQIQNTNVVLIPANAFPNLNHWLRPITTFGLPLGLIGLVILAILIFKSEDKFLRLRQIGWFLAIGVALNLLLIPFVSSLIPQYISNPNAAVIAGRAFDIFSQSYINQLIILAFFPIAFLLFGYLFPGYKSDQKKRQNSNQSGKE